MKIELLSEPPGSEPMDADRAISILLVEDEERLRRTLVRSLEARQFRVEEARTAAEGLAAMLQGGYDVVLLDVNLPDATGWDVLRDLRQAGWHIPVVVLSAVAPNPARVREFRPHGVLLKPFPMDALLNLVRSAAGGADAVGQGMAPAG